MVAFGSVGDMGKCLRELAADPDIRILRVKNRMVYPSIPRIPEPFPRRSVSCVCQEPGRQCRALCRARTGQTEAKEEKDENQETRLSRLLCF
eukprot:3883-Rhodomonas_salina.1